MSANLQVTEELKAAASQASIACARLGALPWDKATITVLYPTKKDYHQWIERLRFVVRASFSLKERRCSLGVVRPFVFSPPGGGSHQNLLRVTLFKLGVPFQLSSSYPNPAGLLKIRPIALPGLNVKAQVPIEMLLVGPLRDFCDTIGHETMFRRDVAVDPAIWKILPHLLNLFEKNALGFELPIRADRDQEEFNAAFKLFVTFLRQMQEQSPETKSSNIVLIGDTETSGNTVRIVKTGEKFDVLIDDRPLGESQHRVILCACVAVTKKVFDNEVFINCYSGEYRVVDRHTIQNIVEDLQILLSHLVCKGRPRKTRTWIGVLFKLEGCDRDAVKAQACKLSGLSVRPQLP